MGQAASDGGAGPELDITLDAVTDDDLVKDLSQIVETQEATKDKLLAQIASCQRQLDRLQAVSDAGRCCWSTWACTSARRTGACATWARRWSKARPHSL